MVVRSAIKQMDGMLGPMMFEKRAATFRISPEGHLNLAAFVQNPSELKGKCLVTSRHQLPSAMFVSSGCFPLQFNGQVLETHITSTEGINSSVWCPCSHHTVLSSTPNHRSPQSHSSNFDWSCECNHAHSSLKHITHVVIIFDGSSCKCNVVSMETSI